MGRAIAQYRAHGAPTPVAGRRKRRPARPGAGGRAGPGAPEPWAPLASARPAHLHRRTGRRRTVRADARRQHDLQVNPVGALWRIPHATSLGNRLAFGAGAHAAPALQACARPKTQRLTRIINWPLWTGSLFKFRSQKSSLWPCARLATSQLRAEVRKSCCPRCRSAGRHNNSEPARRARRAPAIGRPSGRRAIGPLGHWASNTANQYTKDD